MINVYTDPGGSYSGQAEASGIVVTSNNHRSPLEAYAEACEAWIEAEWQGRYSVPVSAAQAHRNADKSCVNESAPSPRGLFDSHTPTRKYGNGADTGTGAAARRGRRQASVAGRPPSVIRGAN